MVPTCLLCQGSPSSEPSIGLLGLGIGHLRSLQLRILPLLLLNLVAVAVVLLVLGTRVYDMVLVMPR